MQRIVTLVHKLEDERNKNKKSRNNNENNNFVVCENNTKYVDPISLPIFVLYISGHRLSLTCRSRYTVRTFEFFTRCQLGAQ